MSPDRHVRTLLYGGFVAGAFLILDQATSDWAFSLAALREFVLGAAFGAAVLLAPDRRRALRGGVATAAVAVVVWGLGLPLATAAALAGGALWIGRLGRRPLWDAALVVAGLALSSGIAAHTLHTEALALWAFFLLQALHPVVIEGDLVVRPSPAPAPASSRADAFSEAQQEILAVLEA